MSFNSLTIVRFVLFVLLFTPSKAPVPPPPPPPPHQCIPREDGCSCKFSDGGVIDLTSLGSSGTSPRFKDIKQTAGIGSNTFSYSPCKGFTENGCTDAAMCITSGEEEAQQIGDSGHTLFLYDEESTSTVAAYTHRSARYLYVSEVLLQCDMNACEPKFEPKGEKDPHYYSFTLTSVCACPNQCTASGAVSCTTGGLGGLSVGSILLIVGFSVVIIYFMSGVTFMKMKNQATGANMIPHKEFWTAVPKYIKGGVSFTLSKVYPARFKYEAV